MSWSVISDGRWSWDGDNDRHLLLHAGDRLVEFHERTVHVYSTTGDVDLKAPLGKQDDPDTAPAWVRSDIRDDLADVDDATVWAALTDQRYQSDPEPAVDVQPLGRASAIVRPRP